jgi:tRNA-splicing ligase RtcB
MVNNLFNNIPSGVGSKGQIKLSYKEEKKVLEQGAVWAINNGYGTEQDLENIEENGKMSDADYQLISNRALERGKAQLGTLGSGNHFVEVGVVQELFDQDLAQKLGLEKNQIIIIIHTGSRGFGHQVCDDYIKIMQKASSKYGIELPDRQLCCAPITSKEGKEYLAAMACAVNFSFCNRQIISHRIEDVIQKTFGKSYKTSVVYEVAHNIAKLETHLINGKKTKLCVHRKGATRAFGPHHPELSPMYQSIGQPVLIPGDMGRYSYVLLGTEKAMTDTFGSTCHGAGRVLSRRQAAKASKGRSLFKELEDRGITVRASSRGTMAEEISDAYKDVANVVDSIVGAGISKKVAKLKPIAVIKG